MPRIRSLILRVEVDEAKRAHNCQANAKHRIKKGEKRLRVHKGQTTDHYCLACARKILEKNLAKLQELEAEIVN